MTRMRELRQGRGLKCIDLAFETRVHPAQISGVERRKVAASAKVRQAVCTFLDVPEKELFDANGLAM